MVDLLARLFECTGFQWDEGNVEKNWVKHKGTRAECEEVFYSEPLLAASDVKHSHAEARLYALGRTDAGRVLFVVFTIREKIREKLIRVISARDMSPRERKEYERAQSEAADAQGTEV